MAAGVDGSLSPGWRSLAPFLAAPCLTPTRLTPDPLTDLLYRLQDGRQRATYGAVAAVVGAVPMFVMSGRPRDPLHSWVVNAQTGRPTRYADDQVHADLQAHDRILRTEGELREWLDGP